MPEAIITRPPTGINTNSPTAPTIPKLPPGMTFTQWQAATNNAATAGNLKDGKRKVFWENVKVEGMSLLKSVLGAAAAAKFGGLSSIGNDGYNSVSDAQINDYYNRQAGGVDDNTKNPFGLSTSTLLLLAVGAFLYFQNKKN